MELRRQRTCRGQRRPCGETAAPDRVAQRLLKLPVERFRTRAIERDEQFQH
jgi:hypothetical protein